MAYDGYYANQYQTGNMNPDANEHGYSQAPQYPYHETDHLNMPQPQMPTGSPANPTSESYAPEPYAYPEPQRYTQNPSSGHINDAVNSAVHNSGSTGYLSPEVLSQITATVIQQLKTTGLDSNLQGSGAPPPRSQSQQPPWQTDTSLRVNAESPHAVPQRSTSIPPPSSLPGNIDTNFQAYVSDYNEGYPRSHSSLGSPPPPTDRRASVSSQESGRSHLTRPRPPDRDATVMEMTTLERVWQTLFDEEKQKPTRRLGQFLRGIAVHLIEDYEPKKSIVISPEKLQKFYLDTHDPDDPYPWHDIFDDRTSQISRLFREVKAEHHLVQKNGDPTQRPDIPGLTPKGFEQWATQMIIANPDREHRRLAKAVLNMPISNPDDTKERFPKELPRSLFPDRADISTREKIEDHIMKHCNVDLPYITEEERNEATNPQPPTRRSPSNSASTSQRSHSYERGRPLRAASTSTTGLDRSSASDDEEVLIPGPIERERKPYSAAPGGGGKKYEEDVPSRSRPSASASESTPKPRRSDRDSLHAHDMYSRGSRSSSRSVHHQNRGDYRHSESDLPRDRESRYSWSAQDQPFVESPVADDDARYRRRAARHADEYLPSTGMLGGQGGSGHGYDKYYR